jgi:hypothetical protein
MRLCCRCQAVLGEKCRECGTEAVHFGAAVYVCPNPDCPVRFIFAGTDGVTHGYCPECVAREVAAMEADA